MNTIHGVYIDSDENTFFGQPTKGLWNLQNWLERGRQWEDSAAAAPQPQAVSDGKTSERPTRAPHRNNFQ